MAEPGQQEDVERRAVDLAEVKAGVRLPSDRRVVLTVKDLASSESALGAAGEKSAKENQENASGASSSETPGEGKAAEAGEKAADTGEKAADAGEKAAEQEATPETNFHVQLELPDGSDYAKNKSCVLEIPGHPSVEGKTDESGELTLSVPNVTAEGATLRVLDDGGAEIASWPVTLRAADEAAQSDAGSEA